MASFDFDQAEGLRRMLQGPRPRIVTFLSATPEDDKGAMLVNLGASLAQLGDDVLIVDACEREYGVSRRLGISRAATLAAVAHQECALNQVLHAVPQGFSVASLGTPQHGDERRLANTFDVLVKHSGIVMVDAELGPDGELPLPLLASSEIVVQVSTSATSITNAYALIKRLSQQLGRRPFGILVTGATEAEAKVVYDNMSTAATRYLAVTLSSMGSVPA
ncbi:MAG: MinD/ParA family ATP-binding protein, partial [Telluria sp.]